MCCRGGGGQEKRARCCDRSSKQRRGVGVSAVLQWRYDNFVNLPATQSATTVHHQSAASFWKVIHYHKSPSIV